MASNGNKLDENGEVIRNKAILVCKGYAQEERIDYGETFSPIARMEGIRTLLAYATYKGFKFYPRDIKFAFLNGILNEEGYFGDNKKDMVCKFHKDLYGLKQAPRAWYERLNKYLLNIGFERTDDNNNLYIKIEKGKGILLSNFFLMIQYFEVKMLYERILQIR